MALAQLISTIVLIPSFLFIALARFFYQTSILFAMAANMYVRWILTGTIKQVKKSGKEFSQGEKRDRRRKMH